MASSGQPLEHPSDAGEQPFGARVGRKRSEQPKRYVVTVRSAVPDDLAERISAIHAVAIRQGAERSGRRTP